MNILGETCHQQLVTKRQQLLRLCPWAFKGLAASICFVWTQKVHKCVSHHPGFISSFHTCHYLHFLSSCMTLLYTQHQQKIPTCCRAFPLQAHFPHVRWTSESQTGFNQNVWFRCPTHTHHRSRLAIPCSTSRLTHCVWLRAKNNGWKCQKVCEGSEPWQQRPRWPPHTSPVLIMN